MAILSNTQLARISACRDYPPHLRQLAVELAEARKTIASARRMLSSILLYPGRPESAERVEMRHALARYDALRASFERSA